VTVKFYSSLDSAPLEFKRQPHEIEPDRATARAAAPCERISFARLLFCKWFTIEFKSMANNTIAELAGDLSL
jgi:hypothetical protein